MPDQGRKTGDLGGEGPRSEPAVGAGGIGPGGRSSFRLGSRLLPPTVGPVAPGAVRAIAADRPAGGSSVTGGP